MTFYAKPTNRPLALEGWFEKPTNRLSGHIRVKDECEYDWYWKISAYSTEYEVCDSFASLTRQTSYSGSAGWYFRYQVNGVHLSHSLQVAHVCYQLFDSKMADGNQLWSMPKLEYDLLRRNASTNGRKTDLIERHQKKIVFSSINSFKFYTSSQFTIRTFVPI